MSATDFDVVSIQKEKMLSSPRFELKRQQKTLACICGLVFGF